MVADRQAKGRVMREKFADTRFSRKSAAMIEVVNSILEEYAGQGYDLTLRQLYYQLVARAYIENSVKTYKQLGGVVSDARMAGLIDWDMIADRGRQTITPTHWESPGEMIEAATDQFAVDKWADQDNHVEVMVEKQALEGVLIPVCRDLDIRFTANKGYSSMSALYEAGRRLRDFAERGKSIKILYLGDHDPSGLDMTRDVDERIKTFVGFDVDIVVDRLALNGDQIRELNPPENPAKATDTRFKAYADEYGLSSWELDAIEPRRLAQIVTTAVEALRDATKWEVAVKREDDMKADLLSFATSYSAGGFR